MITVDLPDGHVWLRITRPHYDDHFDTSFAQDAGGRWNPPGLWPTLYLNHDVATVHAQVRHMFVGRGVEVDDLDDSAPINLAAALLPDQQQVLDVSSDDGAVAAGLPATYPLEADGRAVDHDITQQVGRAANDTGLDGVYCRSASGVGLELAWFPNDGESADPAWTPASKPFGAWRHATTLSDI